MPPSIIVSRHIASAKDKFDERRWNAFVNDVALVVGDLLDKSAAIETARDDLVQAALYRVNEILVPAIEAALEIQANASELFDPSNYYQKTDLYTQAEVTAAITAASDALLGASPPSNLNSFKEIAAAINNDPNFYSTIMAAIAAVTVGAHTHAIDDVVNLSASLAARSLTSHTHDYTAITGLVAALAAKASDSHTHDYTAITGLVAALAAKAATAHQHSIADITDMATAAQVRAASFAKIVTADLIASASAVVSLTDAATIGVDWSTFIMGDVTLTANRALGNPTNVKPGTSRSIMVKGNSATLRALTFGTYYKSPPTLPNITSSHYYLLQLVAYTATHIAVGAIVQVP